MQKTSEFKPQVNEQIFSEVALLGQLKLKNYIFDRYSTNFLFLPTMKRIVYIASLLLFSTSLSAQYNWDVGFKLGGSNYLGEMGGKEQTRRDFIYDMKLKQTRWAVGGFVRYRFTPILSASVNLTYARIQGSDALSTNPARVSRNLSFRNDMFEFNGRGEIVFYQDNDVGNRGRRRMDFKAFAFAGLGGLVHSPKANLNGTWVALRPLQTEGPANSYSSLAFTIPTGLGLYFTYKRKHRFGWEMGWRTTFTDYLDDVSTEYVDPATLSETGAALANRNPELWNDSYNNVSVDNHELYWENNRLVHPDNYGYYDAQGNFVTSKRGDPSHNDSYLFMTFTYSYVIRGKSSFYRQKYGWLTAKRKRGRKSRAKF